MRRYGVLAAIAGVLIAGTVLGVSVTTPPYSRYRSSKNPNRGIPTNLPPSVFTQEWVTAPSLTPPAAVGTVTRWIPWYTRNSITYGYQADQVSIQCVRGTGCFIRPFGPYYDSSDADQDIVLSADADSSHSWSAPAPVDSLWLWDTGGSTSRCLISAR